MIMVMVGGGHRARAQAEYLARRSPEEEAERVKRRDVRHQLSIQRARNILRWLAEPNLALRWQQILLPHMKTPFLRKLAASTPDWADAGRVREELVRRQRQDLPPDKR